MIDKEGIHRYIEILGKLDDSSATNYLKNFLFTYDGTNVDELNLFVVGFIAMLIECSDLKIKAKGFDQLAKACETTELQKDVITKRFESLSEGILPSIPLSKPDN